MKTLKFVEDLEVSNVSMIKFIGDFDVNCDAVNSITIRCFDGNNAITIHNTFIDDCDKKCRDELKNALTLEKFVDNDYARLTLDVKSDFSFDVCYKNEYTIVSVVLVKNTIKIK